MAFQNIDGVSIVLCGQAGQGIQTVEGILTQILKHAGNNIFATKEYMSRIRGGANSIEIRTSENQVTAFVDKMDILIALDKGAVRHVEKRISPETVILAEKEMLGDVFDENRYKFIDVPFTRIAAEIGNKIYANTVAAGMVAGMLKIELSIVTGCVKQYFSAKSDEILQNNLKAAKAGHELGARLISSGQPGFKIGNNNGTKDQILLNGTEAVALGAIAGGCNFISAYPMSPSTGVLTFLTQHANEFGIIAEQAEDEIAAINMAIGAWYAGARAMVTTSGGGFALMTEGVSLAAMLEMPIVIHLAQRPGPATGLPTRTEQGDLELALYSGHGEFPRIIFAPGKLEDAFYLTCKAFNLADKYQIPVFVLTDQHLLDSYYNVPAFDLSGIKNDKHIVETTPDYRRYASTESGVSPRGVPGFGAGVVVVDSDEHDMEGHITEDLEIRIKMVEKRLKKAEALKTETIPPELTGGGDFSTLIVCWGSTYNVVNEAVEHLHRDDVAVLYFKQVYPIHDSAVDYLKRAKKRIIVENNATGQFARLLKLHTGTDIENKILKYNGLGFSIEELVEKLNNLLQDT